MKNKIASNHMAKSNERSNNPLPIGNTEHKDLDNTDMVQWQVMGQMQALQKQVILNHADGRGQIPHGIN